MQTTLLGLGRAVRPSGGWEIAVEKGRVLHPTRRADATYLLHTALFSSIIHNGVCLQHHFELEKR